MQTQSTEKTERTILKLSFFMGLTFAVVELFAALWSHSNSMLMDAAYDATELIVIALTIFLTPLFHKPLTEKRPFGYAQVESVFITIKNLMMLSVTVGLLWDTIDVMLGGGNTVNSAFVASFQLVLGCVSFVVLSIMKKKNRTITSPIITTEIYGWKIDTYYSFGMSGAFFVASLLKNTAFEPILPYFDQLVAIGIVLFMIPEAVKMLIASLKNMFLFSPDGETLDTVKTVALDVLEPYGYKLDSCDVYKIGRVLWADIYIETTENYLLVAEYARAGAELQTRLAEVLHDCQTELILYTPEEENHG